MCTCVAGFYATFFVMVVHGSSPTSLSLLTPCVRIPFRGARLALCGLIVRTMRISLYSSGSTSLVVLYHPLGRVGPDILVP